MTTLSESELRERLGAGKPVVVDFTADWCGPCRALAPEFERLAQQYGDSLDFVKVDVDASPALAAELRVMGVPTLVHFDASGQEVARTTGAQRADALAHALRLTDAA